jgi:hypothetical protein
MNKAISSLCLCAALVCFGGSARAERPKIAVLGLEVAPGPGGTVDPTSTQVAKDITNGLRTRAQSGASPYMLAPNSNKELTDEKLLMSCDNEGKDCMAVIGAGLTADELMYGRVERKGDQYRITLKLLDVKAKTVTQAADETPVKGSTAAVVSRLYGKLVGEPAVAHTAPPPAKPEQAPVAAPVERPAVVESSPSSSGSSTTAWKITFGAGVAVAALSGAYAAYAHSKVTAPASRPGQSAGSGDCDASDTVIAGKVTSVAVFHHACHWNSRTNDALIGVGLGAAAAVVGAILWYRGAKHDERAVAIAPVIAPGQAGALLSFRW